VPIYDIKCDQCNYIFEELMAYSDPNPICTKCGSSNVIRLFGIPNFDTGPRTLGKLAENNAKKMTNDEHMLRQNQYNTKKQRALTQMKEGDRGFKIN
jgi:putative FmdB family regulatory protein